MKLIFLVVATIALCSVLIEARPPVRRIRIIRVRIIRVIPIRRRGRRDVSTEPPVSGQAEALPAVSRPDFSLVGGGAVPNANALRFTSMDEASLSDVDFEKMCEALLQCLEAHHVNADANVEVEVESASDSVETSANDLESHNTLYETVWEPTEVGAQTVGH